MDRYTELEALRNEVMRLEEQLQTQKEEMEKVEEKARYLQQATFVAAMDVKKQTYNVQRLEGEKKCLEDQLNAVLEQAYEQTKNLKKQIADKEKRADKWKTSALTWKANHNNIKEENKELRSLIQMHKTWLNSYGEQICELLDSEYDLKTENENLCADLHEAREAMDNMAEELRTDKYKKEAEMWKEKSTMFELDRNNWREHSERCKKELNKCQIRLKEKGKDFNEVVQTNCNLLKEIDSLVEDCNELERRNEILRKDNNSLVLQRNELIKLVRSNNDV